VVGSGYPTAKLPSHRGAFRKGERDEHFDSVGVFQIVFVRPNDAKGEVSAQYEQVVSRDNTKLWVSPQQFI
jgi:hypothetical protein